MNCEKKSFFEMMDEVGPVIKYDDNGRKVFFFNPYYKGKDPMKEIFWGTKNADEMVLSEIHLHLVLNMDMTQQLMKNFSNQVSHKQTSIHIQICNKVMVLSRQMSIRIGIRRTK